MKYLAGIIGIMLLMLLAYCQGHHDGIKSCEPCIDKSDTVVITKRDTIWPDTNKIVKKEIKKPKPIKVYPDLTKPQRSKYVYNDTLENNEVAIYVTDSTEGQILNKVISYRLKVPLRIIDSVFTTITNVVEKPTPQRGLFIGAEIGTNLKGFRIAPEIEYLTKTGYAYSYNYDVLNNFHSVGIKKKLKL